MKRYVDLICFLLVCAVIIPFTANAWWSSSQPAMLRVSGGTPTPTPSPTPAYKNIALNVVDTSVNTITTSTNLDVATNDLLVCQAGRYEFDNQDWSTVDCGANSLTKAGVTTVTAAHYIVSYWYKEGATAGSTTCAAANPGYASTYNGIQCMNYSGVATSSALDGFSCNSASCNDIAASSTNRTAQNITTTNANDLLVAFELSWNNDHTYTAAGSFNRRSAASGVHWGAFDKIVSSTGSYPAGNFATVDSSDQYISGFMAFKAQ